MSPVPVRKYLRRRSSPVVRKYPLPPNPNPEVKEITIKRYDPKFKEHQDIKITVYKDGAVAFTTPGNDDDIYNPNFIYFYPEQLKQLRKFMEGQR